MDVRQDEIALSLLVRRPVNGSGCTPPPPLTLRIHAGQVRPATEGQLHGQNQIHWESVPL